MARSIKKGPLADEHLMKKVEAQEGSEKKQAIRTWSRCFIILPNFIGHTFAVYDGRKHVSVYVTEDMVGHRLGESVPIRTFKGYVAGDKETGR